MLFIDQGLYMTIINPVVVVKGVVLSVQWLDRCCFTASNVFSCHASSSPPIKIFSERASVFIIA